MNIDLLMPTLYWLVFSLVIIRITSNAMIDTKRVTNFVPFYAVGIVFSLNSSFIASRVFDTTPWIILELSFFIVMSWVFINLRKSK